MASDSGALLQDILSYEEFTNLPDNVRDKIEQYLKKQTDEHIVAKALLESAKINNEQKFTALENDASHWKEECEKIKLQLDSCRQELEVAQNKMNTAQNEVAKLKEIVARLEAENADFRHQRDLAVDERNEALKTVAKQNLERQRLQEEVKSLSDQLQAAISEKCDALVKIDAAESREMQINLKEKRMEQERERLNIEIEKLNEELDRQTNELNNLRRGITTGRISLETQLSEKVEELRIANEQIIDLAAANNNLQDKMEANLQKLMTQRENEAKMQETFDNELAAHQKLQEVYKSNIEDVQAKNEKLQKSHKELQEQLNKAVEQYEEAEALKQALEDKFEKIVNEKDECIQELKIELQHANELLKAAKEENLEKAIEELSPAVANISRNLQSGITITQLFMQYAAVTEELVLVKNENRNLNEYITSIMAEIGNKVPSLKKQREEYEFMKENFNKASQNLEAALIENSELKRQLSEASKLKDQQDKEIASLKEEMEDLAKQVCFLLAEIEGVRSKTEPDRMDTSLNTSKSSEIISKNVVTFRDIKELQTQNQKLLALVRTLSKKAEEEENETANQESIEDLKELLRVKTNQIESQREQLEQAQQMLNRTLHQVETYQKSVLKQIHHQDEMDVDGSSPYKSQQEENKLVAELKTKVQQLEEILKEVREEAQTYRVERQANDRLMNERYEAAENELHDLRNKCSRLSSQLKYNEERLKMMRTNATTYKTQIAALEEKNKNYNAVIIKHEQSILYLKDELVEAQRKLSRAEVGLENARRELHILKNSEVHVQKEKEMADQNRLGQAVLLANLDQIRASLQRSEVEGKVKLEKRLDESLRECGALRRRLLEEEERFRGLTVQLQTETDTAKSRLEEEKKICAQVRDELQAVKEELKKAKEEIDSHAQSKDESTPAKQTFGEFEADRKKMIELQNQLRSLESELESTKELLKNEKNQSKKFGDLSEEMEKKFNAIQEEYQQYKEMTEKKITTYAATEDELRKRISSLEGELSALTAGTNKSSTQLNTHLLKAREEVKAAQEELHRTKQELSAVKMEIASLTGAVKAAEDKYANEVALHSADLQALATQRLQYTILSDEMAQLRAAKEQAEKALETGKSDWEEREYLLKAELQDAQQRVQNLESQNSALHDQIEALSSQLTIALSQVSQTGTESGPGSANTSLNTSLNTSIAEADSTSEQLMQIIKYLRREKDMATSQFDILRTENQRLKSQLETIKKQFDEAKKSMEAKEQESNKSAITAAKHAELLRKLETLNAITDSNRILRSERDSLQLQVKELSARVEDLEKELFPLRDQKTELSSRVDSLEAENVALRNEAGRLRQRVNYLIERSSKTSMEDWRRLQQERENLAKQVMTDKELLQKMEEEARLLRQDKTRLEEQVTTLSRQQQQQMEEVRRLTEELGGMQQRVARLTQELTETKMATTKKHQELAKITEELGAKETLLTDTRSKEMQIRKIAKKYKTQFEELTKTMEKEKQEQEEKEKAIAAAPIEVPPETQEQYREEGRREVENKHSERLRELEEQVTSSQQEAETLREENNSLKSLSADREEKAKQVLKNARQKIHVLLENKTSLIQQLAEVTHRMEAAEQNRDEGGARMAALKTNYESRIARLEKENADLRAEKQREMETSNARLVQLQRQLDKLQGAKPSTSSGPVEKVVSEPPTANIKPMAGPTQQSVTVTPWPGRGETPLASIRPMSMQSRTLAVLPTNMSQITSQSTPVLVPPQQVHTTGSSSGAGSENLSSSPTSSHTDYMPTTSSASGPIRQVVVQPTVATVSREEPPQSTTESTQDLDEELQTTDDQEQQQTPQQQQPQQPSPKEQSQQPQQQQQQQVVAMVLPRVEQQPSQVTQPAVEQAVAAPSSQASSSSNTVTTSQAGHKRPREAESEVAEEEVSKTLQPKRTRVVAGQQEMFSTVTSDSGLEVEYQVPTSSQRDQEDEILVVDSEDEVEEGLADDGVMQEPDDGPEFDDEDNGNDYVDEVYDRDDQDLPGYDEGEGGELDEESAADQDNNEVEIMGVEDSEVPNQSESCAATMEVDSNASVPAEPTQEHSEATSSGTTGGQSEPGSTSAERSFSGRGPSRTIAPLGRQQQQQQLLLGYEDLGDDSIVPSTPTLFVPRRSDGFGEAVSSPHVPQGRFTFSETHPPTARAGLAQVASEGMDDTRMDLTQLEESGTGRSVPTTPLQVSPQGDVAAAEMSSEIGQSEEGVEEQQSAQTEVSTLGNLPAITITEAGEEDQGHEVPPLEVTDADEPGEQGDPAGDQNMEQDDFLDITEEGSDGVSSEGEKVPTAEDVEEGCEAEASEQTSVKRGSGSGTARRSARGPFRGARGRGVRPQPIVWNEPGSSHPSSPRGRAHLITHGGSTSGDAGRGQQFTRAGPQRARRTRGKPGQYQMRF